MDIPESYYFPPVSSANDEGVLAVGGDLSTGRLIHAYRSGIFPMFEKGEPILW
jgi:leucyl/phenylalanyl-tRNA--protein transferase